VWPADTITTERLMDEHSQSAPQRPRAVRDGESPGSGAYDEKSSTTRPLARRAPPPPRGRFEPPVSALEPLFLHRFERIHDCRIEFSVDISTRPTRRVLGGYYRSRGLVRVYAFDSIDGRRPVDELFDTFLHEVAHHLEYTEPSTFGSPGCWRVPGLMHSRLFWRILGELKWRWAELKAGRSF
jgi:hypothetical protein